MNSPETPSNPATSARRDTDAPPRLGRIALIAVGVIVVAVILGLLPRLRQRAALLAESKELATPTVIVVSPSSARGATAISLPAEVKALVEAPIYARANGYVKRWLVDIGTNVAAGQLLAEIDTPELNQELSRARAQLTQAEAALKLARTTANRWASLAKTDSVTEQEAVEKQSDLELKAAGVEAARAEVHRLEELAGFARITAPFAGIITARQTDVGQLVSAGSGRELFRLAQTGTLRVFVRVPQAAARTIAAGQNAELTLSELPGRVFAARVVRTAGAMDVASRTLLTELEVDNSQHEILAGSYAQVRIPEANPSAAMTLPSNTLLFRAEGPQVGVVRSDNKVELRRVKIGRDFGANVEILDGVQSTDRVILNPADSLVGGAVVRIADSTAEGNSPGSTNRSGQPVPPAH